MAEKLRTEKEPVVNAGQKEMTVREKLKELLEADHGISGDVAAKLLKEQQHIVISGLKMTADRLATTLLDSPPTETDERPSRER